MTVQFAHMGCSACLHEIWAEAGGLRHWNGQCPKCGVNSWTWVGWTSDKLAGIRAAASSLEAKVKP